jgi:hypothetical protein
MYDLFLLLHFIGLALGVGTGFAGLTLGLSARGMEANERTQFMLRTAVIGKNGGIGLLCLLVSGIGMTAMRGVHETLIAGGPPFHLKLTLVLVMMGLLGYLQVQAKRAREAGGGPALARIATGSRIMLGLGLTVITCAVLAFH